MAFQCGLFQLSVSSGVPVYPANVRWVAQWYHSVHWVNQWYSSGIAVYTGPASVHWLRVRDGPCPRTRCSQFRGHRWPRGTRRQGISSHDIDLVPPEYIQFSTKRIWLMTKTHLLNISMVQCMTALTPSLTYWSYCSLTLTPRYDLNLTVCLSHWHLYTFGNLCLKLKSSFVRNIHGESLPFFFQGDYISFQTVLATNLVTGSSWKINHNIVYIYIYLYIYIWIPFHINKKVNETQRIWSNCRNQHPRTGLKWWLTKKLCQRIARSLLYDGLWASIDSCETMR